MSTPSTPTAEARDIHNILNLQGQLIGKLETKILLLNTLLEQAQRELTRERLLMQLSVRQEAGLSTPEEEEQLRTLLPASTQADAPTT